MSDAFAPLLACWRSRFSFRLVGVAFFPPWAGKASGSGRGLMSVVGLLLDAASAACPCGRQGGVVATVGHVVRACCSCPGGRLIDLGVGNPLVVQMGFERMFGHPARIGFAGRAPHFLALRVLLHFGQNLAHCCLAWGFVAYCLRARFTSACFAKAGGKGCCRPSRCASKEPVQLCGAISWLSFLVYFPKRRAV